MHIACAATVTIDNTIPSFCMHLALVGLNLALHQAFLLNQIVHSG